MRGLFVFPGFDEDLMQLIEIRGNNGATETVESVYLLTGPSYSVPTRLFALDDPSLYIKATPWSVNARNRQMARIVADFYAERPGPKHITRVHTHPGGNTTPSEGDRTVGPRRKRLFDRFFDDYEFFLGIHGLRDAQPPDPAWLRRPEQTADNAVTWWGENRKHTLALFDEHYHPKPVAIADYAPGPAVNERPASTSNGERS